MSKQFKEGSDFEAAAKVLLGESTEDTLNESLTFTKEEEFQILDYFLERPSYSRNYQKTIELIQELANASPSPVGVGFGMMFQKLEKMKQMKEEVRDEILELIDNYPRQVASIMQHGDVSKEIFK